jgi:hypothetical protein
MAGIMTNLDADLSRRYGQALEQYSNLTRAFLAQADDLPGILSRWFQNSIVGDSTDLSRQWNRFAAALGLPAAAVAGTGAGIPSALDALLLRQAQTIKRLADLALECQRLQAELAQHWARVGEAAAARFAEHFQPAPAGAGDDWARQAYARWIDIAEQAYTEAAHSGGYAALIADLSNSVHAFKVEQAALMDMWARQFNQPTRAEMDALNLQIKELRAEVRELRKAGGA